MPKTTEYHPVHKRRRYSVNVAIEWTEDASNLRTGNAADQTVLVHTWLHELCEKIHSFNGNPRTHDEQIIDVVINASDSQTSRTHLGEMEPF